MAFKTAPLTPIPAGTEPQLYQYLKRLEDVVRGLTGGVNEAQNNSSSTSATTLSTKMDKVYGAAGDIAVLDGAGGLNDSGLSAALTPTAGAVPIADDAGRLNDWVDLDDFFNLDENDDLVPASSPTTSPNFELDSNSDIQPKV